jgi:hypothetical protein
MNAIILTPDIHARNKESDIFSSAERKKTNNKRLSNYTNTFETQKLVRFQSKV